MRYNFLENVIVHQWLGSDCIHVASFKSKYHVESSVIPWTEFKGRRVKNNNNVVYNIPVIQKFLIFLVAHIR
jgi:hypothetical protein